MLKSNYISDMYADKINKLSKEEKAILIKEGVILDK